MPVGTADLAWNAEKAASGSLLVSDPFMVAKARKPDVWTLNRAGGTKLERRSHHSLDHQPEYHLDGYLKPALATHVVMLGNRRTRATRQAVKPAVSLLCCVSTGSSSAAEMNA